MDVFDSPLNLAHQQSRKADSLVNSAHFDEAIECHQKAADLLSEAMTVTDVQQALESLSLQRQFHIKEQVVVRDRQRRAHMAGKVSPSSERPASKTPSQEEPDGAMSNGDYMTATMTAIDDNVLIMRTMEECDSLLQFLKSRSSAKAPTDTEITKKQNTFTSGTKIPIDDKLLIEELRVHNDALRFHILELLKENEQQSKENKTLRQKMKYLEAMTESRESEKCYPLPSKMSLDDLPSIELPPLEMPQFDFDTFKLQACMDDQEHGTGSL